MYLFMIYLYLFNDAANSSDYVISSVLMFGEKLIGRNV